MSCYAMLGSVKVRLSSVRFGRVKVEVDVCVNVNVRVTVVVC